MQWYLLTKIHFQQVSLPNNFLVSNGTPCLLQSLNAETLYAFNMHMPYLTCHSLGDLKCLSFLVHLEDAISLKSLITSVFCNILSLLPHRYLSLHWEVLVRAVHLGKMLQRFSLVCILHTSKTLCWLPDTARRNFSDEGRHWSMGITVCHLIVVLI